jgi:hypothetical protein
MEDELYYEMVKSYVFIWDVNGEDKYFWFIYYFSLLVMSFQG